MVEAPEILVTLSTFSQQTDEPRRLLEQSGYTWTANSEGRRMKPSEVIGLGRAAVGIVAGVEPYDAETLQKLPQLRCLSRCGVGLESIDLDAARNRGIQVSNTPDEVVDAVAEHTLALMLALLRRLPAVDAATRRRRWERQTGNLLAGKAVGIIGLGRIGRRVAELLAPFRVKLFGSDPNPPDPAWTRSVGIHILPLNDLLPLADIVTLHAAPDRPDRPLLGVQELARLRRGSWLINTARASLLDEPTLLDALYKGRLAGAALDVFEEEPYRGPLCEAPNVVLTPHQATLTAESRNAMEVRAVRNLLDFMTGIRRPESTAPAARFTG